MLGGFGMTSNRDVFRSIVSDSLSFLDKAYYNDRTGEVSITTTSFESVRLRLVWMKDTLAEKEVK